MSSQLLLNGQPIQILNHKVGQSPGLLSIGDSGQAVYNYRFIRFYILSNWGESNIQMNMMQFYSDDGAIFQYPQNCNATSYNVGTHGNETFETMIQASSTAPTIRDGKLFASGGKICGTVYSYRCQNRQVYCQIDMGDNKTINLRYFKNWRWFASNDTYNSEGGYDSSSGIGKRNIKRFELYVSNDSTLPLDKWKLVDYAKEDLMPIVDPSQFTYASQANYGLFYNGKITLY